MAVSIATTKTGEFADTRRSYMRDGAWITGCDTLLFPTDISQGSYAWSVNCLNRGGIISTRPKRRLIFHMAGVRAQGLASFVTLSQTQYLVWAIDGLIYYSVFPFTTYQIINGLAFSPVAPRVYFQDSIQAATYNPDNTIAILPTPVKYLFIQDGTSSPGWWDGTNSFQPFVNPSTNTTNNNSLPIGTAMATSGGRLWVVVGRQVYASDYVIPTKFQEQTYLAEKSGFQFPRLVTALLQAPQDSGLFVFTDTGVYSLQSNIVDRTKWQTTDNFQSTITEYVGNIAPFAPIYQHGLPWFFSAKGFISMDMAMQTHISNVLYPRDGEMRRSKAKLSPDLTGICTGVYENMLMVGVPHASNFNRHIWIQDGGIAPKLNSNSGACWTGVWTGTYPVQFTNFIYQGLERNFELSYANGYRANASIHETINVWENFTLLSLDANVTPVRSQFETRMFVMDNDELMQACFVEVFITQLSGIASLSFYVGGIAGVYTLLSTSTFRADQGPFFSPTMQTIYYGFPGFSDTIIESYRPQNRYPRSVEINIAATPASSHFIEVDTNDMIDKGFQVLLKWTGNLAIRGLKLWYRPSSSPSIGTAPVNESANAHVVLET